MKMQSFDHTLYSNQVCRSSKSKPCLRKNEVGDFAEFMQAGDPCFLRKGRRVSKTTFRVTTYNY